MPNIRWGRHWVLMAAPLLALVAAPILAGSVNADAPPTPSIDTPAQALAPAQRLGVVTTTTAPPPPPPPGGILFPMNPLPKCFILDNFGDPRSGSRSHAGDDILASLGQEIYAVVSGTLIHQLVAGQPGAELAGNYWVLRADSDQSLFVFGHMSAFADGLVVGSHVTAGQIIGKVGDTGNAGPGNYHLHFGYQPQGGAYVDPISLLRTVKPASCTIT
jgi:murein DD-endopeptidase MepM/ murein hydrolase activator NlpD